MSHKPCKMMLTADERIRVLKDRAYALTGFSAHSWPFEASKALANGETVLYYVWKMGEQPRGAQLEELLETDPMRAAYRFLSLYAPLLPDDKGYRNCFAMPKRRQLLCFYMTDPGYCRVYYKAGDQLYCFQECGGGAFELMGCTKDGEPIGPKGQPIKLDYLPGKAYPEFDLWAEAQGIPNGGPITWAKESV